MYRTDRKTRCASRSVCWLVLAVAVVALASGADAQNREDVVTVIGGGNPEGSDDMLKIYRPETKPDSLNYIVELVALKYAPADEVAEYVDEAVELEGGLSKALEYTDPKTGEMRQFLEVVTTPAQMPSILDMIKGLDLPEMKETGSDPDYEVRMRYRRASEVAEILEALEVENVSFDDSTNTVHFKDSESKLKLVDFYDVPPLQVQFEIEIIEVREQNAAKLGLDWDAWKRSIGGEGQLLGGNNRSGRLDWLLSLDSAVLADFLNYTAQEGNADIKQNVVLNINNGAVGQVSTARTIPSYDFQRTPSSADLMVDSRTNVSRNFGGRAVDLMGDATGAVGWATSTAIAPVGDSMVQLTSGQARADKVLMSEHEEGMLITIEPVIGTELVTMNVVIDARTLSGFDRMDRPIVSGQTFETSITLKDQQSLHAATIEREVEVNARRGIPGLRKVPGVRNLFSSKRKHMESSKTFVIITPCYCESVSYDARLQGGPGDILKFKDTEVPQYIPRFDGSANASE